jgi:hypothetical protein
VIALYSRYEQNTTKIPHKYKVYTQYTHPTLICRGTDTQTDARTNARMDNIYSIFRDKLLLLGEHVLPELIRTLWDVCKGIGLTQCINIDVDIDGGWELMVHSIPSGNLSLIAFHDLFFRISTKFLQFECR